MSSNRRAGTSLWPPNGRALRHLARTSALGFLARGPLLVLVLAGLLGFLAPGQARGQTELAKSSAVGRVETALSGPDWKLGSFAMDQGERSGVFRQEFDDRGFRTVVVPGEVQLQLGFQGMDLYYQTKELTSINQKEWWYRKRFTVPKDQHGKVVRLVFDGVDYFASVWLNGKKLGEHEGCFVPFSFDVTSQLNYDAENLLVVKVTCPWLPKGRGFLEYLKGEWMMNDWAGALFPFPPYLMGPHYANTPAYGNATFPMGLWRDVKLVASASTVIEDLFVRTKTLEPDGSATLEISGTVRNYGSQDAVGALRLRIAPDNFEGESLTLPMQSLKLRPGKNSFNAKAVIKNPRLWWTWDSGLQNLYKLAATISPNAGGIVDTRDTVLGIRTIARNDDMSYWLNGKRLFLKGAWYPEADYFGSKPTRETYEKDLRLFRAANLNHLVAFCYVEKPDFYDLCDRLGILVFFEFPFQQFGPLEVVAPASPRHEIFIRESLSQLRQIIIQLRNHPSIIVWAAFAEAHEKGGKWGFGAQNFEDYGYGAYSDQIAKLVADLAPGTIYHPSLCDLGEQHFWMANAGMGIGGNYTEHFPANTGFVSEYGSEALPSYETLQKVLPPEDLWSTQDSRLPRWFDLPINISAYAYLASFEYDALASILHRTNQFVDRHIKSAKELVEDSQLYQAFIYKYATEAYRRKKYHSINGTRIWCYGDVYPGIQWCFLDYYRVPKMGYYYLKTAQERFAVNFAYEEALESQVSGKRLEIPVWVINDYRRAVPFDLQCEILDLEGHRVWSRNSTDTVGSDEAKQSGVVEWTTPEKPGVYLLRARAVEKGGEQLTAQNATFIKVTPRLFSRKLNLLVIGQRKYAQPIALMAQAMGLNVDVIEEVSIHNLDRLRNAEGVRQKYDVVWLASFDSIWKLLDDPLAQGLKEAVSHGLGLIHTGGPGSFHGGFGLGACLELTALEEVLPVTLQSRNDLIFGPPDIKQRFSPLKDVQVAELAGQGWSDISFKEYGLPGFNQVRPKPDSQQLLTISGAPLLVTGRYGEGHTVAFTGFTPEYAERRADWDPKIVFPYLVDQEFVTNPIAKTYFSLFMRMLAAATGEQPATSYDQLLLAKDKPLFEVLQDLPPATLAVAEAPPVNNSGAKARMLLRVTNGPRYARLVRIRAEWNGPENQAPYLVMYSDNDFDLLPGESKTVTLELLLPAGVGKPIQGRLYIEGSNVAAQEIPVSLPNS